MLRTPQQRGVIARSALPGYAGKRPRMQLWHGTADDVLRYPNLESYSLQNVEHDLTASGMA